MITIKCEFLSCGKPIKKTAILSDNLGEISRSKRNQCTDIEDNDLFEDEGFWSLIFDDTDPEGNGIQYEIEFVYEYGRKILEPIKAITWESDYISDVQNVSVIVK